MDDLLAKEKPSKATLADGKEYTLPAMTLTNLANIQKDMGFKLMELQDKMADDPIENGKMLVYALLHQNYPDLSPDDAGNLVTLKEMTELTNVFSGAMTPKE